MVGDVDGINSHRMRARNRLAIGVITKGEMFASRGKLVVLTNSFRASARGCGTPIILTLFGPFRS